MEHTLEPESKVVQLRKDKRSSEANAITVELPNRMEAMFLVTQRVGSLLQNEKNRAKELQNRLLEIERKNAALNETLQQATGQYNKALELTRQVAEQQKTIAGLEAELRAKEQIIIQQQARLVDSPLNIDSQIQELKAGQEQIKEMTRDLASKIDDYAKRDRTFESEIKRLKTEYPVGALIALKEAEIAEVKRKIGALDPSAPESRQLEVVLTSLVTQRDQLVTVRAKAVTPRARNDR